MQAPAADPRAQSVTRRSHSMSAPQRPSQFMIFSNTTPHKHPSPLRRITARVRAHFDSSTESDVTRRPRSHTQPSQYHRQRVFSEGHSKFASEPSTRRATPARDRVPSRQQPYEAGPHDLWMGGRVSPRLGLRTPVALNAVGGRRPPAIPKSALSQLPNARRSLPHTESIDSMSDIQTTAAHVGHSVSVTSSFVMLDNDPTITPTSLAHPPAQPYAELAKRARARVEADGEWVLRNGRRHLRSQFTRGVKQERRERKGSLNGGASPPRCIPYPVDYSPETLASYALGHLLHSAPEPPSVVPENVPRNCLDLGCGGGEWIRSALRRWPTCEFVGMDIVLLNRAQLADTRKRNDQPEGASSPSRVSWVKGDFLAQSLPFDSASFDRVHLRDLARAVPYHAWASLLSEIGRVLRPGGVVDITADDIIFPILPRSLTAHPTSAEVIAYREKMAGRGRDPSREEDAKPPGTPRFSGGASDNSRGRSDETVRNRQAGQTQGPRNTFQSSSNVTEWGTLPRDAMSEAASVGRCGSTIPLEIVSRPRGISLSKPRSRSRDMFRGTFSDGENGVRAGIGRILRGSRRSAAISPPRSAGSGAETEPRKSSVQPFFIPCVSASNLQGSSPVLPNTQEPPVCEPVSEPIVRVSQEEPRRPTTSHASLGLGVPSFGFALSSAAFGSVLSLRSMDGSIINAPIGTSALSLPPTQPCSNLNLAHSSVISFQGPLSPPLTPPRKELLVAEINTSVGGSDLGHGPLREEVQAETDQVRPSLGHDYELLEELFYAVYARRDIHTQLTNVLRTLMQSTGIFETVQAQEPTIVNMPRYQGAGSKRDEANTPPTPEMSPKSGNIVRREVDVATNQTVLHLKYALQGILAVREAMWEELVLRRDLGDSPDERVRHERMQFEEMVESYAKAVQSLIDVPSRLVSAVQWRRPVPREQTLEQKWVASESQKLRDAWATREAIQGLAGYSTFSRRTRHVIAVKA